MYDDFWKSFVFDSGCSNKKEDYNIYFFKCPPSFFEAAVNQERYKGKDIIARHILVKTNLKGDIIKEFQIAATVQNDNYHYTQQWIDPYDEFCMDAVDLDSFLNELLDFYNL